MSASVNKVLLIGNLGGAPEIRRTADGKAVVNLSIATSETWRDKSTGERKEKTEWHRVVIWNEGLCKIAEQYLSKGSKVYIEGQQRTRKWQDQQGNDRYTTEVVLQGPGAVLTMLYGPRGDRKQDDGLTQGNQDGNNRSQRPSGGGATSFDDLDDEVPFAHCLPTDNVKRRVL